MITFVYWLWQDVRRFIGGPRVFNASHVNAQAEMLKKFCTIPYKVVCVADNAAGLHSSIEFLRSPVSNDGAGVKTSHPTCFRRLWNFSTDAVCLGDRIVSMDLDTLIHSNIDSLFDNDDDLIVWKIRNFIMGGFYILKTGKLSHVWNDFDFKRSIVDLLNAGYKASDQDWLNFKFQNTVLPCVNESDGVHVADLGLKHDSKIVSFSRHVKPWTKDANILYPWLNDFDYWKTA